MTLKNIIRLPQNRRSASALLSLALDANHLQAVEIARQNGDLRLLRSFSTPLALDVLSDDPKLAGLEIRKHLDAAGIQTRQCAVCIPAAWALTVTTSAPEMPDPDLANLLELEAERVLPQSPAALSLRWSICSTPGMDRWITITAVPHDRIDRIQNVLLAARLRPISISLDALTLSSPDALDSNGTLNLVGSPASLSLSVVAGEGLAALRTIDVSGDPTAPPTGPLPETVLREIRITLGMLPPPLRDQVTRARLFGNHTVVNALAAGLEKPLRSSNLQLETRPTHLPEPGTIPPNPPTTPSLSLALRLLTGRAAPVEYLPPRVSPWKQLANKYSSARLRWAGAAAAALIVLALATFGIQQWRLSHWQAQWKALQPKAAYLAQIQQDIRRFRPWFDQSYRPLSLLRQLTEAFPDDGAVSAKTLEIRDPEPGGPSFVTCSGAARNNSALMQVTEKLSAQSGISNVHRDQTRGTTPIQFRFSFQWSEGGEL
jgi:hypothetical protein